MLFSRTALVSSIIVWTAMFVDIGMDGNSRFYRSVWDYFNEGSTNNSPKGRWEMLGGYLA